MVSQRTNANINETCFNNMKENMTKETENRKILYYQIYRVQE